jgi:hypothetical protein
MVGFAAGAVGAVARAGIVVNARLRAVERFGQLSKAIAASDNRLLRFGRNALIASGQITLLSGALKILANPITGLLALVQVGLSTRSFVLYERAARRAQFQLEQTGMSASRSRLRLEEYRRTLGTLAARDLFNVTLAFSSVTKLTGGWEERVVELGRKLEVMGIVDFPTFSRLMSDALLDSKPAFDTLIETYFPNLKGEVTTAHALFQSLVDLADEENLTNIERLALASGQLTEIYGRPVGEFVDGMNAMPRAFAEAALAATNWGMDVEAALKKIGIGFLGDPEGPTDWKGAPADPINFDLIKEGYNELVDMFLPDWFQRVDSAMNGFERGVLTPAFRSMVRTATAALGSLGTLIVNSITGEGQDLVSQPGGGDRPAVPRSTMSRLRTWALGEWKTFWESDLMKPIVAINLIILDLFIDLGKSIGQAIYAGFKFAINLAIKDINSSVIDNLNLLTPGSGGGWDIPHIPLLPGGDAGGGGGEGLIPDWHNVFPNPPGGSPPTINIYIGDEKIDSVVLNSLDRITRFRSGLTPHSTRSA